MQEIALFGTVFIDIKGFSKNKYDPVGRNVGNVQFIHCLLYTSYDDRLYQF